jgi:hypothetical protein
MTADAAIRLLNLLVVQMGCHLHLYENGHLMSAVSVDRQL